MKKKPYTYSTDGEVMFIHKINANKLPTSTPAPVVTASKRVQLLKKTYDYQQFKSNSNQDGDAPDEKYFIKKVNSRNLVGQLNLPSMEKVTETHKFLDTVRISAGVRIKEDNVSKSGPKLKH